MKANKLSSYKKCPKSCHSHHSGTKVVLTSFQTFLCDVNSKHGIQIVHIHVWPKIVKKFDSWFVFVRQLVASRDIGKWSHLFVWIGQAWDWLRLSSIAEESSFVEQKQLQLLLNIEIAYVQWEYPHMSTILKGLLFRFCTVSCRLPTHFI